MVGRWYFLLEWHICRGYFSFWDGNSTVYPSIFEPPGWISPHPPQGRRERYWWWVALGSNVSLLGSFPLHVWKWICFLQTNSFPVWADFNYFHVALLPHIAIRYTVFIIYIYMLYKGVLAVACLWFPDFIYDHLDHLGQTYGPQPFPSAPTLPFWGSSWCIWHLQLHRNCWGVLRCFLPLRFFENFSKDVSTKNPGGFPVEYGNCIQLWTHYWWDEHWISRYLQSFAIIKRAEGNAQGI